MLPRDQGRRSDPPRLALRAEGGGARGVGHLARCLALAQAWTGAGGASVLVSTELPAPWDERFRAAGIPVAEPGSPVDADWWLVDGYDLDGTDAPPGARVARIDDHGTSPPTAVEVLVDQNLGATHERYRAIADEVLAGTRYALLRRELVALAEAPGPRTTNDDEGPLRLVVAAGGSPGAATRAFVDEVLAELATLEGATGAGPAIEVDVLDGSADPGPRFARADLALAASGSTCWELALFAVPSVLFAVAPNQEPLGRALADRSAASYVGTLGATAPRAVAEAVHHLAGSPQRRGELAAAMGGLVDGWGARRVATRLRSSLVQVRAAGPDDARAVWELNGEPGARAASHQPDPIPWDDHLRWYAARMDDPGSRLYLASWRGGSLGLVRFQVEGGVAEIGVVVEPSMRGRGWGGALIDAGVRQVCADAMADRASAGPSPLAPPIERITAEVLPGNVASSKAFLDADFDEQPAEADGVLRYARPMSAGRRGDARG